MRMSASRLILTAAAVSAATGLWWVPSFDIAAGLAQAAEPSKRSRLATVKTSPVIAAAKQYAEAIASGDRVAFGRLDFDCQYGITSTAPAPLKAFLPDSDRKSVV